MVLEKRETYAYEMSSTFIQVFCVEAHMKPSTEKWSLESSGLNGWKKQKLEFVAAEADGIYRRA